ncbi:MAG: DUF418 domain-containing protein [Cyclobacteriaceae bacterium]
MSKTGPVSQSERLGSLDFLRGIAVLGILMINIGSYSYPNPFHAYAFGFEDALDRDARFWIYLFFQGKFFSIFALLFGVGFYIFLERMEVRDIGLRGMDVFARRLFWLFVFGAIHAIFIWHGDILYHYATCGLLLFPFRSFKTPYLFSVVLVIMVTLSYRTYQSTIIRAEKLQAYTEAIKTEEAGRSDDQQKAIETWIKITTISKPDGEPTVHARIGGYWSNVQENLTHVDIASGQVFYAGIMLRTLMLMMIGILMYRLQIFSNYQSIPYYWLITVVVLALGLWMNYVRCYHWTYEHYDKPIINEVEALSLLFYKEVLAIGYILLFNGLYQKWLSSFSRNPLVSVGRMALTNYISQSVICVFIFYGFGFGLFNQWSRSELIVVVLFVWGFQMIFSMLWLKWYQWGPLEALWRKLTYKL